MSHKSTQNHLVLYLKSRNAIETIILPIVIYSLVFWTLGAGWALILTGVYGVLSMLFGRQSRSVSVVILLLFSGAFHYLYLSGFKPLGIKDESVFLSLSGALTIIVVFSFYSLMNRPIIQVLAESGMPRLKTLPFYGSPLYLRVWHEVSLVWIIAKLIKLLIVFICYRVNVKGIEEIVFLFSWPFTLCLIVFSVKWPKWRWQRDTALSREEA